MQLKVETDRVLCEAGNLPALQPQHAIFAQFPFGKFSKSNHHLRDGLATDRSLQLPNCVVLEFIRADAPMIAREPNALCTISSDQMHIQATQITVLTEGKVQFEFASHGLLIQKRKYGS